jgi:TolB-like protein/tetratricopeptide (TPR) repeat protein
MFTDIVGYTALMAESEASGHRVRERQAEVLRPVVERYAGEWIQHIGDETLASFSSAVDAVNCALAIQASLRDEPELRVRVGIHVGDVVYRDGSVHGDGVNIAARVRPLAEPGGICVSEEVRNAIRNQENVEATPLGEHDLSLISVFRVQGRAAAPSPIVSVPSEADRGIHSLAVLPLENLSGDPEQEYFSDGMTEALIGDLARIGALRVISRTSVMQYKRERKPLPEIAQELDVDAVVEGTVMRAGERVRITVQLIDARADSHLWNDRYDRDLRDVLDLQSEVARAVAEGIGAVITGEERASLTTRRPVDPRAHDAYLRGLEAFGSGMLMAVWAPRAIEEFERAVELDPEFGDAYAGLANARNWLAVNPFDVRDRREYPKAREAAERALELDDRMGAAHAVLGSVLHHHEWDFDAARRAYERAVQVSPSDPTALHAYAYYLLTVERTEEALGVMDRLQRIAPFDQYYRGLRVRNLGWARQYERALEELDRVRELDPDYAGMEVMATYTGLGRLEEAHLAHVAFYERSGPHCDWMREALERGWSEGGRNPSIRSLAEAAREREGYSPLYVALWYSVIGETDEAFDWLERGYREHDPGMILLKVLFRRLRSDPRYDDLLRSIGFPEN